MIENEISKEMSDRAEGAVKKRFEKLGYSVCRPDRKEGRRRPDFIIFRSGLAEMICEVKAISSDKYLSGKDVRSCAIYDNVDGRFKKIDDDLADAVHQRDEFVEDYPKYGPLPFWSL